MWRSCCGTAWRSPARRPSRHMSTVLAPRSHPRIHLAIWSCAACPSISCGTTFLLAHGVVELLTQRAARLSYTLIACIIVPNGRKRNTTGRMNDALLVCATQHQHQELGSAGSGGAVLPGADQLPGRALAAGGAGGCEGSLGAMTEAASHVAAGGGGGMPATGPADSRAVTGPSSSAAFATQLPSSRQVHQQFCPANIAMSE